MMPSQKLGIEMPKKPNIEPRLSAQEFGLAPAQTPSGMPSEDRDQHRGDCKLDGRRQPLADQADDRIGIFERHAKIAGQDIGQKSEVLNVDRLIEAPAVPRFGDVRRRGLVRQQKVGRVARRRMDQEEDQQRDQHDDGDRRDDPAEQVSKHRLNSKLIVRAGRRPSSRRRNYSFDDDLGAEDAARPGRAYGRWSWLSP